MPHYSYTAKSLAGEEKSGELEAKDMHQLARSLRSEGLILVRANPELKREKRKFEISIPFLNSVPLAEKMFFTRNLQIMINAGAPLPRAIETLASQAKNSTFRKALWDIREQISKGKTFSENLSKYPSIFSKIFQSMVKVGEESGTLDEVLKTLALQMEKENELKSKIRGAMMYPTVILCAMLGIGVLMMITVVPELSKVFEELEIELPAATQFIIGFADFLSQKWYIFLLAVATVIFVLFRAAKTKLGKKIVDKITISIPVISPIVRKTNSAAMVRNLSSLIAAGVPILRALEVVSDTLGNVYYRNAILEAAERIKKGGKLSEALRPYDNIFPGTVIQMVEVGEETGETASVLAKLAVFLEDEVSNIAKNMASIIEPVLMVIIGVAVGFFAVSMIQPMYSMLGGIK
ncbi:MAG: type II secretion system F family protein [Candidatus Paceibacterota bacterium]